MKIYSLKLTDEKHEKLKKIAKEGNISMKEVVNKFIDLGFDVLNAQKSKKRVEMVKGDNRTQLKLYL